MSVSQNKENGLLKGIEKNVFLRRYTTFKIGGRAKYFYRAKNTEDLIKALSYAQKKGLPFYILGGGSNVLVSDQGFEGLVIKINSAKYEINDNRIHADAGVALSTLINASIKSNLSGLEWSIGIPGSVGGAVFGNAGASKEPISDSVKEVEFFDSKKMKFGKFKKNDCKFRYRSSIFKRRRHLIILSVLLELKKKKKLEIQKKIKNNFTQRKQKQPLNLPSAGSIFINPKGFSAGKLIQDCGLKGERVGGIEISQKHANFIVNLGNGKAKDVLKLINIMKKSVEKKFGIKLKEEIQYLGFKNQKKRKKN